LTVLGLTFFSVIGAAVWIIGSERWQHIDSHDPGKILAESVWKTASDHGTALLNRLTTLRRRNKSSKSLDGDLL
jgi:hypothetical protein